MVRSSVLSPQSSLPSQRSDAFIQFPFPQVKFVLGQESSYKMKRISKNAHKSIKSLLLTLFWGSHRLLVGSLGLMCIPYRPNQELGLYLMDFSLLGY